MANRITNPYALITRLASGASAEDCQKAVGVLSHRESKHWLHAVGGAQAAFQCVGKEKLAEQANLFCTWLESIINAKDCCHVDITC